MAGPFVYLATNCYGGLVQARYLRSILSLRAACAQSGVSLQLNIGSGEALMSRSRATALAKFLRSPATDLVFADAEQAFSPAQLFGLLDSPPEIMRGEGGLFRIARGAAQEMIDAYSDLKVSIADVRGGGVPETTMLFEGVIEIPSGRYIADLDAFEWRWQRRYSDDRS
jgi:hypothetical protein